MASSSAKSRLFTELSRSRTSSPNADEFATAGSFSLRNDQIINSTVNMDNDTNRQQFPLHYDQHPEYEGSEYGSDGSADMSIELGRGIKRGARDHDADVSSNLVFNFGGDSQYEVTGTPPVRPRNSSRKSDGVLRRGASVRNAAASAKTNDELKRKASGVKHRSLSETLGKLNVESDEDYAQPTATFNARNTRFVRSRQTSANNEPSAPSRFTATQDSTPRRNTANNPTVQSATYTANSFMLPDLPNITELVSGVHKDGTPVFNRTTKSRSRFTSGSYKPQRTEHAPIESVPIPDEEKAIFASLQLLKDRVGDLEMEKSEAQKRAEEYEGEIIDLRSQLQAERRRPDSALGSDEEGRTQEKWRMEKTRLQASVKALQDRFDRSERKISVSDIAVKRVTKERDELVTQIGVAYFSNEELKTENETFRESHGHLQADNEELKEEVNALRKENGELRVQLSQFMSEKETVQERIQKKQESTIRSKKEGRTSQLEDRTARRASIGSFLQEPAEDIATKIAREVQKQRDGALAARRQDRSEREAERRTSSNRNRSKSQHRQQSGGAERRAPMPQRAVSAPVESDVSDVESTVEREITQKTRDTLRTMHLPSPVKRQQQREEDTRDITMLSFLDPAEVAKLRKKLEEEHASARRGKRNVSAPAQQPQQEETVRSMAQGSMPRKSSLKDITAGLVENATGRFTISGETVEELTKAAKTVRVQSPHTSDASFMPQQQAETGDTSILSNTSRRRRRAASAEGMTSAFILPDITIHGSQQLPTTNGKGCCIHHDADSCTACHPGDLSNLDIPTPVPVTDRELEQDIDITTATIRPAQAPPLALASVIKQIQDEITHLKLLLQEQQTLYNQHDPALSKRKRVLTKLRISDFTSKIEVRSDQVYALYDVLEGQKQAAALAKEGGGQEAREMDEEEVEETLMSIGIDPAELAGRVGRRAPPGLGLDGAVDMGEESEELPWEGLSEYESDE